MTKNEQSGRMNQTPEELKAEREKRYKDAVDFYDKGQYSKAVRLFRVLANKGYAPAQFSLGFCYDDGCCVPKDAAKAAEWYRKAAKKGNAYAQYNLGGCYYYGRGVPQDYAKADEWYRKAQEALDMAQKEQ